LYQAIECGTIQRVDDKPAIVSLVSNLIFATRIEDAIQAAGGISVTPVDLDTLQQAVIAGARLIIIDAGAQEFNWPNWVHALKGDPATDRTPIIAFGSHVDAAMRQQALEAGVDRYLARSNFFDGLPEFIANALRDRTDNPCSEPLPAGVIHGLEEFNAGQFFEQHETLELVWRAELRPIRNLYRGILQIGVACLQIERGNPRGALKLIDRGTRWLQPFRPNCQGVEVDRLLEDTERLKIAISQSDLVERALFPKVYFRS
jgi:hypothetical protein